MLTSGFVKRAWIRNQDVPPGKPAPGHIGCPCGKAPETWYMPETGNITCTCGTVYTWNGWIIARKLTAEELADLSNEWDNATVDTSKYYQNVIEAWEVDQAKYDELRREGCVCQTWQGRYFVA